MGSASWARVWLTLYAVGCVLVPPLHFHEKYFFAAEYLLLPLVIVLAWRALKREPIYRPPKILWGVWGATCLAFVAGKFRDKIGVDLSVYYWFNQDQFSLGKDGISFVRWAVIFATPWLVACTLRERGALAHFWKVLKIATLVSGLLAILDHFHVIDLIRLGYHEYSQWWPGRSFGTQSSPLEASIMYGAMALFAFNEIRRSKRRDPVMLNAAVLTVSFFAMLLTQSATAFVALALTLVFFTGLKSFSPQKRLIAFGMLLAGFVILWAVFPESFSHKFGDFTTRSLVWRRYAQLLPAKPWLLISGIGFSGVVVDNSFFLLFIKGGLLLLLTVTLWVKDLARRIPESLALPFWFWAVTFLALDSIGYWALGRVMWLSLGLAYTSAFGDRKRAQEA